VVFVSYSRQDGEWRRRFSEMLKPLVRERRLEVWSADDRLVTGYAWRPHLTEAMSRSSGFDDSAFMNCTDPPLTTVRQPIEAMGKAAVALLVNQIENVAVDPEELLFEPELVVRGSTGRPPSGAAWTSAVR
jgi:hypothetical protein